MTHKTLYAVHYFSEAMIDRGELRAKVNHYANKRDTRNAIIYLKEVGCYIEKIERVQDASNEFTY